MNQDNSRFEKLYCLNFSYTDNEVNVEYVAWNSKAGDYTNVKAKAVYQMNENGMNYMAYNWNEKDNSWNLVTEHNATNWTALCWQTDNYSNKNSLLQFPMKNAVAERNLSDSRVCNYHLKSVFVFRIFRG